MLFRGQRNVFLPSGRGTPLSSEEHSRTDALHTQNIAERLEILAFLERAAAQAGRNTEGSSLLEVERNRLFGVVGKLMALRLPKWARDESKRV